MSPYGRNDASSYSAATGNHDFDRLCAELGIEHRLNPPLRPQTNGLVERFNGRIEDVLQSHHFHSGEELEQTLLRYVRLYNTHLPQAALKGRTPVQALKDWHRERPELFKKRPYNHPGCDTYTWRRDLSSGQSEFDARWAALAGHPPGKRDMPSDDWILTVHPEDVAQVRAAVAALEAGAVERQILTYRRRIRDAEWIWLQVHAGISARDAEGRPTALSGVSFDISAEIAARARAQEEQAQLREDLQRAQQRDTVAQVAGGLAHDLNNLIAVVAGTAEMLELQAGGQPGLLEGLRRIRRSVGMARDLIAGLGGLVRPDLPREANDLGRLLRDAVDLLGQRRIARHALRVELADGSSTVWANPTEVAQVIVN